MHDRADHAPDDPTPLWPTAFDIRATFHDEVAALGGAVREAYDDGTRPVVRAPCSPEARTCGGATGSRLESRSARRPQRWSCSRTCSAGSVTLTSPEEVADAARLARPARNVPPRGVRRPPATSRRAPASWRGTPPR